MVVVGEPSEVFPASKATSLEFVNKSLARPHQSIPTTGPGKEEPHSRQRRSVDVVDGHASSKSQSISSENSYNAETMHDITTPIVNTVSLVHGVDPEAVTIQPNEDKSEVPNNAFLSVSVDNIPVNTGDLTLNNNPESTKVIETSAMPLTSQEVITSTTNKISSITVKPLHETTESVKTPSEVNHRTNGPVKFIQDKISGVTVKPLNETQEAVETPSEINHKINAPLDTIQDEIAYDPENMQGDAFPSIHSFGIQKLQIFKLGSQLEHIKAGLHIFTNETIESEENLKKLHYDSVNTVTKSVVGTTTTTTNTLTDQPITNTWSSGVSATDVELTTTNDPLTISQGVFSTVNTFTERNEPMTTTPIPLTATKDNILTSTTTTETTIDGDPTVNTVDTKTTDVTNHKHVLINLTISADDAENAVYKPLYSLTLTVPTVGNTNEIPTVKITPMDIDPTLPTNFNKPITLEGPTKVNTPTNKENDWGGSCECSCPACITNATDDFYDTMENQATSASPKSDLTTIDNQISKTITSSLPISSTETLTQKPTITETVFTTDVDLTSTTTMLFPENSSILENVETTTDVTIITETETIPTTTHVPKVVCPKIEPPPILILEGEV